MPSPFRSPKTLPEWIELDYYERPRPLRRLKLWLSVAVLLVGALAVGAVTFVPRHKLLFQAGSLSTAHAMFNQDCSLCHTQAFTTATRLWPGNARIHAVPNEACVECHDGPRHQPTEVFTPNCTSCHREHRGREQLAWIVDGHCIDCHADLKRNDGQPSQFATSIHSFTGDHPEFAVVRHAQPDPGTVRFNHQLHLRSDLPMPQGGSAKLDCLDCHQQGADRRYFLPVTYDKHCKQCHTLSVQVVLDGGDERLRREAQRELRDAVQHGLPPIAVDAMVHDRLSRLAEKHPAVLEQAPPEPRRPFPGKTVPASQRAVTAHSWADEQQSHARRQLFEGAAGCRFCHQVTTERDARGLPLLAPTHIPTRWLEHGNFDHSQHRLLNCTECHKTVRESTKSIDVLMPGIAECRNCHTPAAGARSACVECHVYHDRKIGGWHGTRTIAEIVPARR